MRGGIFGVAYIDYYRRGGGGTDLFSGIFLYNIYYYNYINY